MWASSISSELPGDPLATAGTPFPPFLCDLRGDDGPVVGEPALVELIPPFLVLLGGGNGGPSLNAVVKGVAGFDERLAARECRPTGGVGASSAFPICFNSATSGFSFFTDSRLLGPPLTPGGTD